MVFMDIIVIITLIVYGVNKVNKFSFPLLFFIFLFTSCKYAFIPTYVKNQKFNFSIGDTINKLKLSKGFFVDTSSSTPISIFYDNKICVMAFLGKSKKEIDENFKIINSTNKHYFYDGGVNVFWGTYFINQDTLKAKIVNRPSLNAAVYTIYEEWYKIINPKLIKLIAYKQINSTGDTSKKFKPEMIFLDNKESTLKLLNETTSIPTFNKSWILKENWFWLNEPEYKAWNKTQ